MKFVQTFKLCAQGIKSCTVWFAPGTFSSCPLTCCNTALIDIWRSSLGFFAGGWNWPTCIKWCSFTTSLQGLLLFWTTYLKKSLEYCIIILDTVQRVLRSSRLHHIFLLSDPAQTVPFAWPKSIKSRIWAFIIEVSHIVASIDEYVYVLPRMQMSTNKSGATFIFTFMALIDLASTKIWEPCLEERHNTGGNLSLFSSSLSVSLSCSCSSDWRDLATIDSAPEALPGIANALGGTGRSKLDFLKVSSWPLFSALGSFASSSPTRSASSCGFDTIRVTRSWGSGLRGLGWKNLSCKQSYVSSCDFLKHTLASLQIFWISRIHSNCFLKWTQFSLSNLNFFHCSEII